MRGNSKPRVLDIFNSFPSHTTSSVATNYGIHVRVKQESSSGLVQLFSVFGSAIDSTTYSNYGVYGAADGASNSNYGIYGYTPTGRGYAGYFLGNVLSTGAYQISDARFKSNIIEVQNGLNTIMQLNPKSYEYKREEFDFMNLPEGIQHGFLAQEIEKLLPELVNDSFQPYEKPSSNTEEGQGFRFKALNYTGLVPILVSAVQEQQEVIKDLEARISQLEALLKP